MNGKGNRDWGNDGGAVLLTGATGFVGMELLARYLEREDRPVYALVPGEPGRLAAAGARLIKRAPSRAS